MAKTLRDIASVLRSKNSGPFQVTMDVVFNSKDDLDLVRSTRMLSPDNVAAAYGVTPQQVEGPYFHDTTLTAKVTIPKRSTTQDPFCTDVFGAGQHIPLAQMVIPGNVEHFEVMTGITASEASKLTSRSPDGPSALVMLDVQKRVCEEYGDAQTVDRLGEALRSARTNNVEVIFVVLMFSDGYAELSPNNMQLSRIRSSGLFTSEDPGASIHEQLRPVDGEIVLTKKRVSAFVGSGLHETLDSLGISRLVLTGISTSGVVLATTRDAADKDYELTVLSDACADPDPELHQILLQRVFPRHGKVETVSEWVSGAASSG